MTTTQSKSIYDELLTMIIDSDYCIGDKFSTEMELCSKYNVSRSTVREAISMLHAKGYVDVIKGSGTYIKSKDPNTETNTLTIDRIDNLNDFMEIRENVETLAGKLFIKNFDEKNIDKLVKVEKSFENAVKEGKVEKMAMYDESFHRTIFECTGNKLLMNIGEVLSNSFRYYRMKTFANEAYRKDAIIGHNNIIDSLKRKDTSDAKYNIKEHLNKSKENANKKAK